MPRPHFRRRDFNGGGFSSRQARMAAAALLRALPPPSPVAPREVEKHFPRPARACGRVRRGRTHFRTAKILTAKNANGANGTTQHARVHFGGRLKCRNTGIPDCVARGPHPLESGVPRLKSAVQADWKKGPRKTRRDTEAAAFFPCPFVPSVDTSPTFSTVFERPCKKSRLVWKTAVPAVPANSRLGCSDRPEALSAVTGEDACLPERATFSTISSTEVFRVFRPVRGHLIEATPQSASGRLSSVRHFAGSGSDSGCTT